VHPGDLSAGTPWSVSPNNTGVAGIGALADPIHFDGSAHLQIAGGERAQLLHRIVARLATVAAQQHRRTRRPCGDQGGGGSGGSGSSGGSGGGTLPAIGAMHIGPLMEWGIASLLTGLGIYPQPNRRRSRPTSAKRTTF
jgi:hypothetical protein